MKIKVMFYVDRHRQIREYEYDVDIKKCLTEVEATRRGYKEFIECVCEQLLEKIAEEYCKGMGVAENQMEECKDKYIDTHRHVFPCQDVIRQWLVELGEKLKGHGGLPRH